MRKGDKLICKKDIKNIFGWILFEKGKVYEVLYIDNEKPKVMVVLDHKMYANEYNEYSIEWVNENFKYGKG
jgi:hypothetical protein